MNPNVYSGTVHNSQDMEKPKCLSKDEQIKQMCYYIQWNITQS